jgi:DNA polymerase III subunit delta
MTPAELSNALKERDVPPLLLFFGEETFLLEKAVREIRETFVAAESRDFNLNIFPAKDSTAEAILDVARTFPVFAQHRMVLVKDVQGFPPQELDHFLPYLKDPVPETIFLCTADKIDGRKKFYQEFKKLGAVVEFRKIYENQLPSFVKNQAREAGHPFTEEAMALFCKKVGTGLQEVNSELVKLFDYMGEKRLVDVADVTAVVSDTRADSIFELTNALGRRAATDALHLLNRLLSDGAVPLVILTMMVRHFRQLWMTRELLDLGTDRREIPRRIGINPYFIEGLIMQAQRFSTEQYRRIFESFLQTDLALKSSGVHPAALLEKLVLEVAGSDGQAG